MNRIVTFAFFLFLPFTGFAQDWAPYVPGQVSYYEVDDSVTGQHYILRDSFISFSRQNHTVYYRHNGFGTSCPPSSIYLTAPEISLDSIVYRQEHYTYYAYEDSVKLYTGASIGFSWITPAPSERYFPQIDSIQITYDSITYDTVFGFPDSLKHFSVVSLWNRSAVRHGEIVLSKNHGLIKSFGIFRLAWIDESSAHRSPYVPHELIGWHGDSISVAYKLPPIDSFFNYVPGDVLKWNQIEYFESPPRTDYYYWWDSILSVSYSDSTVHYTYMRWSKQRIPDKPTVFKGIGSKSIPLGAYRHYLHGTSAYLNYSSFYDPFSQDLWYNKPIMVGSEDVRIASEIGGWVIGNINCEVGIIPDYGEGSEISSKFGITAEFFGNFGGYFRTLIGYDGQIGSFGNVLPLGVTKLSGHAEVISIFPNPASELITLELSEQILQEGFLQIHDLTGRLAVQDPLNGKTTWPVDHFQPGIYLVTVTTDNARYQAKLLI